MIRRAYENRVNVRPRQQFPVISERRAPFVSAGRFFQGVMRFHLRLRALQPPRVHIAHRHHSAVVQRQKAGQVDVLRLASGADDADRDLLARRIRSQKIPWQDQGRGPESSDGQRGAPEKTSAGNRR